MTKNPITNAFGAGLYIVVVASIMAYGSKNSGPMHTLVGPVAMLSLFTLSAAIMGYIFLYQPFLMYFDNKKKAAIDLFLQTVGVFAVITGFVVVLLFSGVIK